MFLLCGRICLRARAVFPRPTLPAGRDRVPASESACGQGLYSAADSACGQGLRTGAHLRCFPSRRCAAGPSRSRSHGRLRRPKSLPIRHSSAAAQCLTPLGWRDGPVLTSWLHRFACLGLKSRIDAAVGPVSEQSLQRFPSLPPEIQNHCRPRVISEQNMQRFPSLPHEIQNHCSRGASFRAIHAAIPKFTP